jgi:hypothetical protein
MSESDFNFGQIMSNKFKIFMDEIGSTIKIHIVMFIICYSILCVSYYISINNFFNNKQQNNTKNIKKI